MSNSPASEIYTSRLRLVAATPASLEAMLGSPVKFSESYGIEVLPDWTQFPLEMLSYVLAQMEGDDSQQRWWTWWPIWEGKLIGTCGFKGKPNEAGMVEIGYECAESLRGQGFATEMARGLVAHAFAQEGVHKTFAHTLAEENPSTRILQKCGFRQTDTLVDPDEGTIWRWELLPQEFQPSNP